MMVRKGWELLRKEEPNCQEIWGRFLGIWMGSALKIRVGLARAEESPGQINTEPPEVQRSARNMGN